MLAALIIVFREVFEAGLVVGIVLAATRAVPGSGVRIAFGVLAGAGGACIVALFAGTLSAAFDGVGQELFNAAILAVAVAMLAWHNVWMGRNGHDVAAQMRAAGDAVASGAASLTGLSIVVGIAVLREGVEVVLFLYGVWATEGGTAVLAGGLVGLALGASVCAVTYLGLVRIPSRHLFTVTGIMIAFLAAGMAAQAVGFLEQANVLTALDTIMWDSSWILSQKSLLGRAVHTLVGYTDQPTVMQFAVYLTTLLAILGLMKFFAPPAAAKRGTIAVA